MPLLKKIKEDLSWSGFVLHREIKSKLQFIKRALVKPQLPKNPDNKVYIHLGCGDIASPEFINVDVHPAPHVHYVHDVTDLSIFPDGYADLVYACHLLEHIRHNKLKSTLWEWKRILKPGGVLRLSVPDLDKILHIYKSCSNDIACIIGPLMGSQLNKHGMHCSVFNYKYLHEKLTELGFKNIHQWDIAKADHHNFQDWASRKIAKNGKEFDVSLNLEAVK